MADRSRSSDSTSPSGPPSGPGEQGAAAPPAGERADCWPRALVADGRAGELADWWGTSTRAASERGQPALARGPMTRRIAESLYAARRARRLIRGLEGAQAALSAQEAGLARASAARPASGKPRISRLLVVSDDGSERFYREVEKLRRRFEQRLEVLVLECDETALGEPVFGAGRRARALLVDHKDAVTGLAGVLCDELLEQAGGPSDTTGGTRG